VRAFFITFLFCTLVSCSQQENFQTQISKETQNKSDKIAEKHLTEKPLERLSSPLEKTNLSAIKKIGEFALIRNSEIKDEKGWMLPPYKNAVIKMGFKFEPQIGEKITIVPLKVKIKPFQIQISSAVKTKDSRCIKTENEFFWAVEVEKITDKEILETEPFSKGWNNQMPFGVFAIYPSVEFAKDLDKSVIFKSMLPKNVSLKSIGSAIDLDNDNKPDLLSVYFCCGEPEKESAEKCPYLCKKYYKKSNEVWEIFDIEDSQEIC
jgi:hypothetical protein